jgi:phosphorylcholine metabolism protein LicD
MDEKVAIEALRQVKEVLDKPGIEYWLDTGTLLGAVRDEKFIPWDGDIDLGTWLENKDAISAIVPELGKAGFWVRYKIQMLSGREVHVLSMVKKSIKITMCLMQKDITNNVISTEWWRGGNPLLREICGILNTENAYLHIRY